MAFTLDTLLLWGETIYLLVEWLICIVMLFYVPQHKSPGAARTWLLLIFFFPMIGVILYALFGRISLPKKRIRILMKASERIHETEAQWQHTAPDLPDMSPELRHTVSIVEALGELGVETGNHIGLLDDYDASIQRLIGDIDSARHSVHLLYYIFADDSAGRAVTAALIRAAQRGVTCRVLMDAIGSWTALKSLAPQLRANGVSVLEMLPVGFLRAKTVRFDLRNHRKIAVIDGRVGYIGSQNIVDADLKNGIVNEELVVRIRGAVVSQLQVVFLADWYFESGSLITDSTLMPRHQPVGKALAQVLPSGPGYGRANVQMVMVALLHNAHKRVVITTPYFVPDESLLQAMETAVLRGVEVHLVVSEKSDLKFVLFAQKSYYEQMLRAGVCIHVYQPRFLHAKHMSVDENVALIGSSNVDIRSFVLNSEVSLMVYDSETVASLRAIQDRYFADSRTLTLQEWNQRSVLLKSLQGMARLADSLL